MMIKRGCIHFLQELDRTSNFKVWSYVLLSTNLISLINPISYSFIVFELVADVGMVFAENIFSRVRKSGIYFFSVEKK